MKDTGKPLGLLSFLWDPSRSRALGPRTGQLRSPCAAGRYYPSDASRLRAAIGAYLDDAVPPRAERPIGLFVPHGRYIDAGQICADGYRQLERHRYDLVVILGAVHRTPHFEGISIHPGPGFVTPLGRADVAASAADAVRSAAPSCRLDPAIHDGEPVLEVQVPFIQTVLPGVPILPVLVGRVDADLPGRFGTALARALAGTKPLLVVSSDLSQGLSHEEAGASDRAALDVMASLDPERLRAAPGEGDRAGLRTERSCCGRVPAMVLLHAARALGAERGTVVSYATTGDTLLGERAAVTGFGCVALTAPGADAPEPAAARRGGAACAGSPSVSPERPSLATSARAPSSGWDPSPLPGQRPAEAATLPATQGRALLRFARESIRRYLTTGTTPLFRSREPALLRRQGAFVTLTKKGELRGCVGHNQEDLPLGQVVGAMALRAAFDDERFPPVGIEELPDIEIEISLLTPPRSVESADRIALGRDGIVLRCQGRSAVFLPKVALEQGWSREETLGQLCSKAGLPRDLWRSGAELFTFQTEVLREPKDT